MLPQDFKLVPNPIPSETDRTRDQCPNSILKERSQASTIKLGSLMEGFNPRSRKGATRQPFLVYRLQAALVHTLYEEQQPVSGKATAKISPV